MGAFDEIIAAAEKGMPTGVVDLFRRMAAPPPEDLPPARAPRQWAAPGVPVDPVSGVPLAPRLSPEDYQRLEAKEWERQAKLADNPFVRSATQAATGAGLGLLSAGPHGAALGALLGAISGHNRNLDDLIAGMPMHNLAIIPTVGNMPKVLKGVQSNLPIKPSNSLADLGLAYAKVRRPVLSKVATTQDAHPPTFGETLAGGFLSKLEGYYDDAADKVTTVLHTGTRPEETAGTQIHENVHAFQQRVVPTSGRGYVPSGVSYELYRQQPVEAQAFNYGDYAAREAAPFFRALEGTIAPKDKFPDLRSSAIPDESALRHAYARLLMDTLQKQMDADLAKYSSPWAINRTKQMYLDHYFKALDSFNSTLAGARERSKGSPLTLADAKSAMDNTYATWGIKGGGLTPFQEWMKSLGYEGWSNYDSPEFIDLREAFSRLASSNPGDPTFDAFIQRFQAEKSKQAQSSKPPIRLQYPLRAPARQQDVWYKNLPEDVRLKAEEMRKPKEPK